MELGGAGEKKSFALLLPAGRFGASARRIFICDPLKEVPSSGHVGYSRRQFSI